MHTWHAQQSPERRAELDAELAGIDADFMASVRAAWQEITPLKNPSEALTVEETRTTATEILAPLITYLDTPRGASDFAKLYTENPGRLRRTLEAIQDFLASFVPLLPPSARTRAQANIDRIRGENPESAVQLASKLLNALDEIRPVMAQAVAAQAAPTAQAQTQAATGTRATAVGQTPIPDAMSPLAAPGGPDLRPRPRAQQEPAQPAQRGGIPAQQKTADDKTALPGDRVLILQENRKYGPSLPGPNVQSEAVVLETTGSGGNTRHKVRIKTGFIGKSQNQAASRNRGDRQDLVRWVDRNQIRIIERADPAKLDPTSKLIKNRQRALDEMAAAAATQAAAAQSTPNAPALQPLTPRTATLAPRGNAVDATQEPVSKDAISKALAAASRLQSRYQGNKREFLRKNAAKLAQTLTEFPKPIEQVQDWYAGGGTYGLSLVASGALPDVRRVIVNEVDPERRRRLDLALAEGGAFMDAWRTEPVLRELLAEMKKLRAENRSSSPAWDALRVAKGEKDSNVRPEFARYFDRIEALNSRGKAAVTALNDTMFSGRLKEIDQIVATAREDADRIKAHADKARERGVEVVATSLDARSDDAIAFSQDGSAALVLLDPPYYKTAQGTYRDASGTSVHLGKEPFLISNVEAAKPMAPGNLLVYHNKDDADVRKALRDQFGKDMRYSSWARAKGGDAQTEVLGVINGSTLRTDVGRDGSGRGRRALAGDTGVGPQGGVLAEDVADRPERTQRGATRGAFGARGRPGSPWAQPRRRVGAFEPRFAVAPPTDSAAFKRWFGKSQIVDARGEPEVMFRGLMHTGERKTMFDFIQVTPSPRIAEDYATGVAFDDIVERPAPGTDEFDEAEEAMDDRRPQIQAFYVKAENPWDFRDRRHRERLAEALDLDPEEFESGAPEAIEDETVTAAIRELGFDSFYTWDEVEGGQAADVALAVFEQSQLKSATGNRGTFDPENPDIRYSTGINAQAQAILKKHGLAAPVNVTASFLDEAPYCPTGRPTASRGHAGRAGPIVPGSTAGGWCC